MANNANILKLLATAILLSGCAIIPDLGEAPKPRTTESYSAEKMFSSSSVGEWPDVRWWEAYGDAQLNRLMEEALAKAPALEEAEARVKQAVAIEEQAGASLYPNISASGSFTKIRMSQSLGMPKGALPEGFQDIASGLVTMQYELDFWGKNRSLLAAATSETEAAKMEREQARLIVSTSIGTAYADLAQLYANLDAADEALQVRTQSASLIKQRQDNGLENRGSYEQELAAQASAEAEIEALKESIALTKNKLSALMGAGPDRALSINRPDIQRIRPFGLPENLPAELLGRRPDIRAALLRTKTASKRIDAAEAGFYPNVNLIALAGHISMGLGAFTAADSLMAGGGPAISLPILDGGKLRGQYKEARANYDASVANYEDTLLRALHDVANVVTSEKMLAPRLQKTEAAADASEEAYKVINYRYKGGLTSYLAVLRAEDSLIASRRALADLRTRAFTLDVALVRALGGGFTAQHTVSH